MADRWIRFEGEIVDGMNIPAAVSSYLSVPDSTGLASMAAACQVWAAAVDGCIDGAFKGTQLVMEVPLPGGMNAPTGATWQASRVAQTGVITFSAAGSTRRWGQALPALSNSVISGGTVDLANAAIADLIGLLLNPTDLFTNPEHQVLEAALDALLSFRKLSYIKERSGTL